jgi:hypothetical protein
MTSSPQTSGQTATRETAKLPQTVKFLQAFVVGASQSQGSARHHPSGRADWRQNRCRVSAQAHEQQDRGREHGRTAVDTGGQGMELRDQSDGERNGREKARQR